LGRQEDLGRSGRRSIVASLKEFLAGEAEKLRSEQGEAMTERQEWIAAVDRLLAQIKDWLQEADPEQILLIQETTHKLRERMIGTYEIHGLSIGLGLREIRVEPVARSVAGPMSPTGTIRAYGRVDMKNGLEKYMLFRTDPAADGTWIMIRQEGYRTQPFNRESFESACISLLD
jgi:hypothetical protein